MQGNAPDEEQIDPHGECAAEIGLLREALKKIAHYKDHRANFEYICVAMQQIAREALKQ